MARRLNLLDDTSLLLRLDEVAGGTAIDLGVNGLDFTNVGSTAVAVSNEPFAYARRFVRASGQYLYRASATTLLHTTPISIEATVKLVLPSDGEWYTIYNDSVVSYAVKTFIYNSGGTYYMYFGLSTSGLWQSFTVDITSLIDTDFHRYGYVYDGTTMFFYFDGIQVGSFVRTSGGNITWGGAANVSIGVQYITGAPDPLSTPHYLDGDVAEVRVNSVVLKPWEIFNTTAAVRDPQIGFEVDADTICAYNFNNVAEGTLVHDDKLNDNTALDLHYKLNDDAATTVILDDTGTLNGVLYGGKTTADMSEAGKLGTALRFDGAADYVDIPDTFNPTVYTIACWVKLDDTTNRSIIRRASVNPPDVSYSHALRVSSGVFSHYLFDGSIKTVNGTTTVVAGTWYHVAIVAQNSGYMRLYVNGVEEGTVVAIGSMWAGGNRWIFGYSYATQSLGWLDGVLDDLRFYWDALSTGEIYKLWNGGAGIDTGYQYEAHMGSVVGSVPLINGPISAKARDCSGVTGNRIEVGDEPEFTMTVAKTLEIWVTFDSNNDFDHRYIWNKANAAFTVYAWWFGLNWTAFDISLTLDDGPEVITMQSGVVPIVGVPYYLAATWDPVAKTAILYVNGTERNRGTNASVVPADLDHSDPFTIPGTYSLGSYNNMFEGKVHAVRISSVIRTPKEIYDYYNGSNVQGVE